MGVVTLLYSITNPLKLAEFEAKTRKIAHKQETDK